MIDRKTPPALHLNSNTINIPAYRTSRLDNGIQLVVLQNNDIDLVRADFLFCAGGWYQKKVYSAYSTIQLLLEGSANYTSQAVSDTLDFYGTYIDCQNNVNHASLSFYAQSDMFEHILPVVADAIFNPLFPQNELDILKQQERKDLTVNLRKGNYVAFEEFTKHIFGVDYPYGRSLSFDIIDSIFREDLQDFHQTNYLNRDAYIFLAGNVTPSVIDKINNLFGQRSRQELPIPTFAEPNFAPTHIRKQLPHLKQSSIRIGKRLFRCTHKDEFEFDVLNTVLGGYFGSRLMKNIREDKGYTYGIRSSMNTSLRDGYFMITSEIAADKTDEAVAEVFNELQRLIDEPISEEELNTVKFYMINNFKRDVDGTFFVIQKIIDKISLNLPNTYFEDRIRTIKQTTPTRLQELAARYLQPNSMTEVVVTK